MQKRTTYFTMDAESVEVYGDVSDSIEWGLEDVTTSKEPPRTSQICSGPRLIPKIRMQDQAPEASAFLDHGFNAGVRPSNSNSSLQQYVDPSTTTTSSRLTPDEGMYHSFAQWSSSSEQFQKTTSYSPLELASSDAWAPASEDYCDSFPSINGPYPRLTDCSTDVPYWIPGEPFWSYLPNSSDQRNSTLARKSLETAQSVKAIDPTMFPSSLPKGKRGLARKSRQSFNQMPLPSIVGQSPGSKTTSLRVYLSLPNPALSLVERIVEPGPGRVKHFFFDVRNVRSWSNFSLETMLDVPELRSRLYREVSCDTFSTPHPVGTSPATREQLHLAYRDHFGVKLNAALNSSLAQPTLQMHSNTGDNTLMLPDFTSTASKNQEQIRVVGIVLCYEQWRSDMRHGSPSEQVRYLSGLARLQRFFREHGCRYDFIITEIELVCVRYGGDDLIYESKKPESSPSFTEVSSSAPIPIFGYLEVSNAIALSEKHTRSSKDLKMTAGLR